MYKCIGTAVNVGELIQILEELPKGTPITAAGGFLHVINKVNEYGEYEGAVIEDNDYSEEWNEEFGFGEV